MAIRVFLISECTLITLGLERLFESRQSQFELVASAAAFEAPTLGAVAAAAPEVLLLDIDSNNPPRLLSLIAHMRSALPGIRILLLTQHKDAAFQDRAVLSGACGVVDKKASPDLLIRAIGKVHEGQLWLDHETTKRIFFQIAAGGSSKVPAADKTSKLTTRERQIVGFFARNNRDSGKVIAAKLDISEKTLRNHLTSIYGKLGVSNLHGLLGYALENGLHLHGESGLEP